MNGFGQKIPPTEYNPYLEAMRWQGFAQDFQAKLKTKELELEEFKKKFSDAVEKAQTVREIHCQCSRKHVVSFDILNQFIILAPKPDPLVEVLAEVDTGNGWDDEEDYARQIHKALDARGLEIREKNDDQ